MRFYYYKYWLNNSYEYSKHTFFIIEEENNKFMALSGIKSLSSEIMNSMNYYFYKYTN